MFDSINNAETKIRNYLREGASPWSSVDVCVIMYVRETMSSRQQAIQPLNIFFYIVCSCTVIPLIYYSNKNVISSLFALITINNRSMGLCMRRCASKYYFRTVSKHFSPVETTKKIDAFLVLYPRHTTRAKNKQNRKPILVPDIVARKGKHNLATQRDPNCLASLDPARWILHRFSSMPVIYSFV